MGNLVSKAIKTEDFGSQNIFAGTQHARFEDKVLRKFADEDKS